MSKGKRKRFNRFHRPFHLEYVIGDEEHGFISGLFSGQIKRLLTATQIEQRGQQPEWSAFRLRCTGESTLGHCAWLVVGTLTRPLTMRNWELPTGALVMMYRH